MKRAVLLATLLPALACGGASPPSPSVARAPATTAAAPCPKPSPPVEPRLHFRVRVADGVPDAAVSGRLLVAMTSLPDAKDPFDVSFLQMREMWTAAVEVQRVAKGRVVEIDPDVVAWPQPFSHAPAGTYRIAARLVRPGSSTIRGSVVTQTIDPAHAGAIDLRLDAPEDEAPLPPETDTVKLVRLESKLLSEFYGRPITLDAIVILPTGYGADKAKRWATQYDVPGFGGRFDEIARAALAGKVRAHHARPGHEMVRVILPGTMLSGHHVFADSKNDGPWGSALITELVPELERRFALMASPRARVLGGHSSGGWSSLWLMITHPDFFAGTWSTAPDPVDFRSFTGVDVTPGSKDNFYRKPDGSPRMLMRIDGRDVYSIEDFARVEDVMGDVGPLATFDWVFSPRGPLGRPVPIMNRATGEQDPAVQRAWEKFDIHKVLDSQWATLAPKLRGKLHLFAGSEDTFHLNEPLALLCDFLKSKGSDATCEIVPGKTHFDLTGDPKDASTLAARIDREMEAAVGMP